MNRTRLLALALSASLFAGTAAAGIDTDTFEVSITIENLCTVTVADLDFGTQNDLTSAHAATAAGSVTCTGTSPVSVTFDAGTGTGSTLASRTMDGATDTIAYNLYTDNTHTTVLGDGAGGTADIDFTGTDVFTVYGQTDAGQNPKEAGAYSADVTATVSF